MPFTLCDENETIQRIADHSVLGPQSPVWALNTNPNHTSVAVAGSFLLWCRYKESKDTWKPNDIDVWCDCHVYDKVVRILCESTWQKPTEVKDRTCRVGIYNVVQLDRTSTPFYTTTSFDFPVLNGYYNGKDIFVPMCTDDLLKKGLMCDDLIPNTPEQVARVKKYVARGFKAPMYGVTVEMVRSGSWRFNSDYRAYFRVTGIDKFRHHTD